MPTHIDAAYGGQQAYDDASLSFSEQFANTEAGRDPQPETARPVPLVRNRRGDSIWSETLGPAYKSSIPYAEPGLKRVDFRGYRIDSMETLASLFSVYRNERYEHFHYIMLDKDHKLIAHNALTSGVADRCPMFTGDDAVRGLYDIDNRIKRLDAKYVYLLHNHPSGNVHVSSADLSASTEFSRMIPQFAGHVVIDHDKYAYISVLGDGATVVEYDNYDPYNKSNWSPLLVDSPKKAAQLMGDTLRGNNTSALVAVNGQHEIAAWRPCGEYRPDLCHQFVQESGCVRAIYATNETKLWERACITEAALLTDRHGKYAHLLDAIAVSPGPYPQFYRSAAEEGRGPFNRDPLTHTDYVMKTRSLKTKHGFEW